MKEKICCPKCGKEINIGAILGVRTSKKKAETAAQNGRRGGRPNEAEYAKTYAEYEKRIQNYSDLIEGIRKALAAASGAGRGCYFLETFVNEMKKLEYSEKDFDRFAELMELIYESDPYIKNINGHYKTRGPFEEGTIQSLYGYCNVFINCFNDLPLDPPAINDVLSGIDTVMQPVLFDDSWKNKIGARIEKNRKAWFELLEALKEVSTGKYNKCKHLDKSGNLIETVFLYPSFGGYSGIAGVILECLKGGN